MVELYIIARSGSGSINCLPKASACSLRFWQMYSGIWTRKILFLSPSLYLGSLTQFQTAFELQQLETSFFRTVNRGLEKIICFCIRCWMIKQPHYRTRETYLGRKMVISRRGTVFPTVSTLSRCHTDCHCMGSIFRHLLRWSRENLRS